MLRDGPKLVVKVSEVSTELADHWPADPAPRPAPRRPTATGSGLPHWPGEADRRAALCSPTPCARYTESDLGGLGGVAPSVAPTPLTGKTEITRICVISVLLVLC